jgi:hypothetical protein
MLEKRRKPPPPEVLADGSLDNIATARELFWQNVMREILTSLSAMSVASKPAPADGQPAGSEVFDGRLAIVTKLGQRIPIAAVYPLFACGIQSSERHKALSMAVECTVFQVHTPGGEVFTLPLHEIRGFHSLSEELVERIRASSRAQNEDSENEPFGFAAYTSLARTRLPGETYGDPSQIGTAEPAD